MKRKRTEKRTGARKTGQTAFQKGTRQQAQGDSLKSEKRTKMVSAVISLASAKQKVNRKKSGSWEGELARMITVCETRF